MDEIRASKNRGFIYIVARMSWGVFFLTVLFIAAGRLVPRLQPPVFLAIGTPVIGFLLGALAWLGPSKPRDNSFQRTCRPEKKGEEKRKIRRGLVESDSVT